MSLCERCHFEPHNLMVSRMSSAEGSIDMDPLSTLTCNLKLNTMPDHVAFPLYDATYKNPCCASRSIDFCIHA
jgi:hypothetical protein